MTVREMCGYVFCIAGLGLGVFTWYQFIHWSWGVVAVVLFLLGLRLLRRHLDDDWINGDLRDGDIDLFD